MSAKPSTSEKVVVASVIMRPAILPGLSLSSPEFGDPRMRETWEAINDLFADGGPGAVDAVTVSDKLKTDPLKLAEFCHEWSSGHFDVTAHAARVRRGAVTRAILKAAAGLEGSGEEGDALYELALKSITSVQRAEAGRSVPVAEISELLTQEVDNARGGEKPDMLRWGDPFLDRLLSLPRGGVFVLGARPGDGKSIVMGWIRLKLAALGERILSVTTEMESHEDYRRTVAQDVAVDPNHWLLTYKLDPDMHRRYVERLRQLGALPMWYLDRTTSLRVICREIDRRRRLDGVTCVIVDHVNELYDSSTARQGRRQELDAIWLGLRRACQEGSDAPPCTLFIAGQLRRPEKGKENRRPYMSDLKGTGKGEEIASVVVLLHDRWQEKSEEHPRDELPAIVEKHRGGPKGTIFFRYDRDHGHILGLVSRRSDQ